MKIMKGQRLVERMCLEARGDERVTRNLPFVLLPGTDCAFSGKNEPYVTLYDRLS
jgi:hypothetical protein